MFFFLQYQSDIIKSTVSHSGSTDIFKRPDQMAAGFFKYNVINNIT